jgi:conjugative relaxase-like TrwC/TraI family protein
VIASFAQHSSRDADPQLHVHNAVLNRVLREDPLAARAGDRVAWRTLDGAALFAARPATGAVAERVLGEYLSEKLGVEVIPRADGNGWELGRVSPEVLDQFSWRRRSIEPRLHELIGEYRRRHGREPHARALWSIASAEGAFRADARGIAARWEARSRRGEVQALSDIPAAVLGRATGNWW